MDGNLDLTKVSPAEKIWLWRRRHSSTNGRIKGRGGSRMSLNEAAALLSLDTESYSEAEAGKHPNTYVTLAAIQEVGGSFDPITPSEACALARRRSGEDVDSLCRALGGISKPTFFARENEGHPEVVEMWEARGYSF